MYYNGHRYLKLRTVLWVLGLGCSLLVTFKVSTLALAGGEVIEQQDVMRLDNRLTQLEQRLFTMENTLRTLEQQNRMANVSSRTVNQADLEVLRSAVQRLEQKLIEDECGLAKLDERTLTPQRREARRRASAEPTDPCRLNFDAPLRLP